MAEKDPASMATALAERVREDEQFKQSIMENPIAAMQSLGIERDMAWELLSYATSSSAEDAEVAGHGCSGWLTRAGCQCTGFLVGCASRSRVKGAGCTTRVCG